MGHGLVGVKERATLFGGAVSLGARDGEWRVEARLPLEAGAE